MTAIDFGPGELVAIAEQESPELWLAWVTPSYVKASGREGLDDAEALFAPHHREFWAWLWGIEAGQRPDAFVGIWPRGGAKSTSAELGAVALGARSRRRYALYVCDTQDQADDHVGNIGSILESHSLAEFYPGMAERLIGKFGNSKGWRRNRLRTASGFTVDALGLDTAARGVKLEDQRPDLIILDDIDRHDDSPKVTRGKVDTITKSLLPAGSPDLAVLAIQNLVHREGVFARLADGRARFLARRRVSGPIPAVRGLRTVRDGERDLIVAGEASWLGQDLRTCQLQIDDWGLTAFLSEAQHAVASVEGTLWTPEQIAAIRRPAAPDDLVRVEIGIDPSGGDGPDNDEQGIVVAGRDAAGCGWVIEDLSCSLPPRGWGDRSVAAYDDLDADAFVVEANFGGDMCIDVLRSAIERAHGEIVSGSTSSQPYGKRVTLRAADGKSFEVKVVHAARGKRVRAEPVAALAGRPDEPATWSTSRVFHVGELETLEGELTTWRTDSTWSPNRLDAYVWALSSLLVAPAGKGRRQTISTELAA